MNQVPGQGLKKLIDSLSGSLSGARRTGRQEIVRQTRVRLFWLLFLFDVLLIAAVLLSFQEPELIEEVIQLEETREVYETRIIKQTVTHIQVITEVVPYGSR